MNATSIQNPRNENSKQDSLQDWEHVLSDITVERDPHEVPFDPVILEQILAEKKDFQGLQPLIDIHLDPDKSGQIEMVRRVIQKKLTGLTRYCMLLVLMTGSGPKRIAELLNMTPERVRLTIQRGTKTIRECLHSTFGEFPVTRGKRPPLRAYIFPLDTPDEREKFQIFLNNHTIVHVTYRGDDVFREALVIYLTGKLASRR